MQISISSRRWLAAQLGILLVAAGAGTGVLAPTYPDPPTPTLPQAT